MMRMAAKLTVAGVAGYAALSLVTALVGPAVAFMMAILWMILKISLIMLVGYIVLSLLRKRNEDDDGAAEDDDGGAGDPAPTDDEPEAPVGAAADHDDGDEGDDGDDDEPEVIDAEVVE